MKIVCTEKYFTILFVCILFFVEGCLGDKSSQNGSPTFPPQNKTINWYTSLEDARKKSVTSKKLLMIYFFTTWSDWAKKMDKETYSYYKVVEMSGNFICVRIDLDKNPELEKTYNITGNPTVVFEDPFNGKKVYKIEGIRDRHEMTDEMKKMLSYKVEGGGRNE